MKDWLLRIIGIALDEPDKHSLDEMLISEAAGILEVSDFDIFRLGHYHWFRKEEDFSVLENQFGKFITNRADCPFWARDYARKIIDAFNNDEEALKELITERKR